MGCPHLEWMDTAMHDMDCLGYALHETGRTSPCTGTCGGGLDFEFCVFVTGWRHALLREWPFICIFFIMRMTVALLARPRTTLLSVVSCVFCLFACRVWRHAVLQPPCGPPVLQPLPCACRVWRL